MKSKPRIAVGGVLTECNHFGGLPIDVDSFRSGELFRGDELLAATTSVVGGMLDSLRQCEADPAALIYASACPGGSVTSACYQQLRSELLDRLQQAMPVDGVLMPLHGAALVENVDDPEGDLLHAVRDLVGHEIPVVATLDLHAHVTAEMVQHADALLAWETYPHRDQYNTGRRATRLLIDIRAGKCHPTMAMAKVPVITSAIHGSTDGDDPFAELMRHTKSLELQNGVLSTSLFLIHPYMDLPEMGSGGLVITDDDIDRAATMARGIAEQYWARRTDLEPKTYTPDDAINRGLAVSGGPVILVETSDCCGGGAAGDSIATLSALVERNLDQVSLVPVVDPKAAAVCHAAGEGARLTIALGHQLDARWGQSQEFVGTVERLSDGLFTYIGGQWEGMRAEMGPTAVFSIGKARVLITSRATYDWSDEQYRSVGLEATAAKFVVAKNPMNYRLAYGAVAKETYVLNTPGPTPATVRHLEFKKLERPFFPADHDIPGLQPTILKHESGDYC